MSFTGRYFETTYMACFLLDFLFIYLCSYVLMFSYLLFGARCSRWFLYLTCPRLGISHFLWRALIPVSQESYWEAETREHEDFSAARSSQQTRVGKYTYIQPFLHMDNHEAISELHIQSNIIVPVQFLPFQDLLLLSLTVRNLPPGTLDTCGWFHQSPISPKDALLTSSWLSGCWARPYHGCLPHPTQPQTPTHSYSHMGTSFLPI